MIGPGKYDDLCTYVRDQTEAQAAAVLIFGGKHGSGFSMQGTLADVSKLPDILEDMAKQMRASFKKGIL